MNKIFFINFSKYDFHTELKSFYGCLSLTFFYFILNITVKSDFVCGFFVPVCKWNEPGSFGVSKINVRLNFIFFLNVLFMFVCFFLPLSPEVRFVTSVCSGGSVFHSRKNRSVRFSPLEYFQSRRDFTKHRPKRTNMQL